MMNIPNILKELAKVGVVALTEESVKKFVEVKIKPIFANWGKDESRSIELEECLSEYLLRCYAKNNIMTTIVFGRLQKTLEDLYIPLTLEEYKNEDKKWIVDENCYNILEKYNRVLIIDTAGMGKSTAVKYFACQGVNLDKSIPIVIELRRLEKNQSILEYIQRQINSLDKNIEVEEIVDILKKGDFVIFYDGYDEVANENKPDVLNAIQEFAGKANNTKIVITSREEDDLNSLGEFKCVNIKPLTNEEAYELIKKYDNDGEISKKLIKRLKEDSAMRVLSEFLKNPLLVSLLYKTFEYKEEIPYKKIDFYEQVYAALFNDHDKTKGAAYVHEKKTKLDKYQFEQILKAFGFLCLKSDKVEYSSQLIHQLLKQSIERFGWLKISVEDVLHDITHAVPFMQKDGNEFKWVHKSFMEYFASCFMCYDNKESEQKYLEKMSFSNLNAKYSNVLDFCYEIDTLGFRKYVILPYIKSYISRYKQYFQDEYFNKFAKKDLNMAKQILAFDINAWVVNDVYVDKVYDLKTKRYANDIEDKATKNMFSYNRRLYNQQHVKMNYVFGSRSMYIYKNYNLLLYNFLVTKNPELFQDISIRLQSTPLIRKNERISFDDNVINPINIDEKIFSIVVNNIFSLVFDGKLINFEKCTNLVEEIEMEDKFSYNNIFDL